MSAGDAEAEAAQQTQLGEAASASLASERVCVRVLGTELAQVERTEAEVQRKHTSLATSLLLSRNHASATHSNAVQQVAGLQERLAGLHAQVSEEQAQRGSRPPHHTHAHAHARACTRMSTATARTHG